MKETTVVTPPSSAPVTPPPATPNLLEEDLGTGKILLEAEELEKQELEKLTLEQEKKDEEAETQAKAEAEADEKTKADAEAKAKADAEAGKLKEQPLILNKFKTDEDVRNAYSNLEKAFTKTSQELAEIKKLADKPKEPVKPPEPELTPDEFYSKFIENPKGELLKVIQSELDKTVKSPVAPAPEDSKIQEGITGAISEMSKQHPDFEELKSQIADIIAKEIPVDSKLSVTKQLEIGYRIASGIKQGEKMPELLEKAKEQWQKELVDKGMAFVESGSGSSSRLVTQKQTSPEQDIKESILAVEKANPLYE